MNLISLPGISGSGPEFYNPGRKKLLVSVLGAGYGISNNPASASEGKQLLPGITLSGSLGYRITGRLKIDFGPSLWLESKDLVRNTFSASEQPVNKRMFVCLNGYYQLSRRMPIIVKAGFGFGTLIYSPKTSNTVSDNRAQKSTEFYNGTAVNAAFMFPVRLAEKITIYPSWNGSFISLNKPGTEYDSAIDYRKGSFTSDFRVQLFLDF